jgi:hypothetical protein
MKKEFYINGELISLGNTGEFQVRLKKQVSDAKDIERKGGTFSYTIRFPVGPNSRIMKHIEDLQAVDKFNKGYQYRVAYYINAQLQLEGIFELQEIKEGYYSGVLFSDQISWMVLLEGKTLRDLQTLPDQGYTGATGPDSIYAYASRSSDISVLQFPLISYGEFYDGAWSAGGPRKDVKNLSFDDFPPAAYFKPLLLAIFREAGLEVRGKLLEDERFADLLLPYVGSEPPKWNWGTLGVYKEDVYDEVLAGAYTGVQDYAQSMKGDRYTAKSPARYVASYKYDFTKNTADLNISLYAYKVDGSTLAYQNFQVIATGTGELKLDVDLETGDYFLFFWSLAETPTSLTTQRAVSLPDAPLQLSVAPNLPSIQQMDFVRAFLRLFDQWFEVDSNTQSITFFSKEDLFKPAAFGVHLDNVCNVNRAVQLPMEVHRWLSFRYAEDSADYLLNQDLGFASYVIESSSPRALQKKEIGIAFAPAKEALFRIWSSDTTNFLQSLPVIADEENYNKDPNQVAWHYNYVPRLLQRSGTADGIVVNGTRTAFTTAAFPSWLHWRSLYQEFYKGRGQNERGHRIKVQALLTPEQYRLLDSYYPVQLGGDTYELESFDGYDPEGKNATVLTLIKQV